MPTTSPTGLTGSTSASSVANSISVAPVPVTLTYALPKASSSPSHTIIAQTDKLRRPLYISSSNTLISITVTPLGGSPTTYGPTACTTSPCTISFSTTPGPNTLAFTLTDGSSNVLSTFSTQKIIQPSTLNTLGFTANPVVHSVILQLAATTENGGVPVNDLLTFNAQDVDGNTIVGNAPYVDSSGNKVTAVRWFSSLI
jgi:hypothetical protein